MLKNQFKRDFYERKKNGFKGKCTWGGEKKRAFDNSQSASWPNSFFFFKDEF